VDGADDPQDVLPLPLDPGEVDPAEGRFLEGAVVGGAVDAVLDDSDELSEPRLARDLVSAMPGWCRAAARSVRPAGR
jgi:hypothetical protein